MGNRRAGSDTVIRTARRLARPAAARAERASRRPTISLALDERRLVHGPADADACTATTPELAALYAIAERCGVHAIAVQRRARTNIARNYWDGGHDVDVRDTLTLMFSSALTAAGFFDQARAQLRSWLARRRGAAATLKIGCAEVALAGEHGLELAVELLAQLAQARPPDVQDQRELL